ncbi:Costars family protein ABRACL, partial [Leucoagaricus sp. SymC.cos]
EVIKTSGKQNADGKYTITYGVLFKETEDKLEALNGTLKAAKRQKKVAYDAELLLMPRDKDLQVILL